MRPFYLCVLLIGITSTPLRADMVDFVSGTWDHSAAGGSSSSTGWDSAYTLGSTTVNGVTVTLESLTFGTTVASSGNLTFEALGATTGFKYGNNGTTDLNGATLSNYQEWRFTFSEAVEDVSWGVFDVDTRNSAPSWRDAIAAETWNGAAGVVGDGTHVTWNLAGSELAIRSTYALDHVSRDTDTFGFGNVGTGDAEGRAYLNTSGSFTTLSFYLFNDLDSRGTHNIVNEGTFSFTSTPEPSSFVLTACLGICGVWRRRRRKSLTLKGTE